MNAALHYTIEAYDTAKPKLMGRHAAGEGFLRGYARHSGDPILYCYTKTKKEFADFEARVARFAGKPVPSRWIAHNQGDALIQIGCLYYSAPNMTPLCWQRRFLTPKAYSLCAVTHTTATDGVMDALGELIVAPYQPWDALICTSKVVRDTVQNVHARYGAYLEAKFGGKARSPVQLPIIPLGVECDEFAPSRKTERVRSELRKRFDIAKDDVVVLFMGRLSYHAKAHPMPMYLGLEEAAKRTGKKIHLIQAGWFANDPIKNNFVDGAKAFCPSVNALFIDGREPEFRNYIWFAADIFASLSDNIQETFGLTPVEAMAAGLPVVVSDWNGYRDTVQNGVEGFRVPTFMPPPGSGEGLSYRQVIGLDNYDLYIGNASQCVGVDVKGCAEAFTALVKDAGLRRRMGEAGRKRARSHYDWRIIVAAYQALWGELAERRKKGDELAAKQPNAPAHPLREDPYSVFDTYPSLVLNAEAVAVAMPGVTDADINRVRAVRMNDYAAAYLAPMPEIHAMLARIVADGPITVADLFGKAQGRHRVLLTRSLGWLGKMGLVTFKGLKAIDW